MWKSNEQSVDILKKTLSFLEDDYGFALRFEEPRFYYYETANCEVLALFEIHKVFISIGPIGEVKADLLRSGTRGGRIDVKIVSQCIDPKYTSESVPWDAKVDIERELKEYARLLKKYCYKMLRGNFSQWSKIRECLEKRENQVPYMFSIPRILESEQSAQQNVHRTGGYAARFTSLFLALSFFYSQALSCLTRQPVTQAVGRYIYNLGFFQG